MTAKTVLIDLPNHVYADWHAVAERAAETTLRRLESIVELVGSWSVLVAIEAGEPTFRHELSSAYKANRPATPDAVVEAMLEAAELCRGNEWDVVRAPGFEGDDVIATAARIAREAGKRVVIVSGDKDCRQLLAAGEVSQVKEARMVGGKLHCDWWTEKRLVRDAGLTPAQWIDYQALVGDATDNVVGCPSIGKKTATGILTAAGSLDAAFGNPWQLPISAKQRDKLLAWKPQSELARQLVTLRTDVEIEWTP